MAGRGGHGDGGARAPRSGAVRTYPAVPPLAPLYARSLLVSPHGAGDVPRTRVVVDSVRADLDRLAAFCRLTGHALRDDVPLPFWHLVGFPLQVDLLVREPFPFRLLGLVHVRQRFEQSRPLRVDEVVSVSVRATGIRAHRRGSTVDLLTEVRSGNDRVPVWTGTSRYLARGVEVPGAPVEDAEQLPAPDGPGGLWRLGADAGRRWAEVSGDVNPIHLAAPAARLLGFRRALAHGVSTAARSHADLGARGRGAGRFDVEFAKPLLLPSTVRHVVQHRDLDGRDGWSTAVRAATGDVVHLRGRWEPLG